MRTARAFAVMSASLALTAQAITIASTGPLPGYDVWVPEWDFGDNRTYKGTVEEVIDQLTENNPKMLATFQLDSVDEKPRGVSRREKGKWPDFPKILCNKRDPGRVSAWLEGIKYLRKVKGKPKGGPGPGSCGRVSCSWNTGIWFCNDNTHEIELESYADIADAANAAYDKCTDWQYRYYWSDGQAFHKTDNWNALVAGGEGNYC